MHTCCQVLKVSSQPATPRPDGYGQHVTVRAVLATLDLAPSHGGIQTMTAELIRGADRVAFRVIAPADSGHKDVDRLEGWNVRRVRGLGDDRRGYIPGLALAVHREMKKADIGLAMHPNAAVGFFSQSKPFIVMTHGGELRSPRIRKVARLAFPKAYRVVCNSRYTRSEAIALGADPLKCEVVPPGAPKPVQVDRSIIDSLRSRVTSSRIVLCVARLVPHKGQDALIEAMARLQDTHLVLVGTGPHEQRLRSLAHAKAVEDRVLFAGRVDDAELTAWYAAADAFALCSRATSAGERAGVEGAGIAILEAMSMRLPVVASPTGGIPETVIDGATGLLAAADKPEVIARALSRIIEDEPLRKSLVDRAFEMVTTERSWTRFVQRIEDICQLIARDQGALGGAD